MRLDAQTTPIKRLSLTPLIDVVFLLLVFFMLAASFHRYDGLDVSGSKAGDAAPVPGEFVLLRVSEGGALSLNGKLVTMGTLPDEIARIAGDKTLKVAIKPDQSVDVQAIVTVIDALGIDVVSDILIVH